MAEQQYRLSIVVDAKDLASGKLGKVKAEVVGLGKAGGPGAAGLSRIKREVAAIGPATRIASAGFARVSSGAKGMVGALSHAKGAIGSLISGPLGPMTTALRLSRSDIAPQNAMRACPLPSPSRARGRAARRRRRASRAF